MAWKTKTVNGSAEADPPVSTGSQKTIVSQQVAGAPANPYPMHMVAGTPYPMSAQQTLGHWNRATGNDIPVPYHTVYNSPRNRMSQT
jgi:hypothetical protein